MNDLEKAYADGYAEGFENGLKGEWIPVEEELPDKSGKYLVTVKNGNVYAGTFSAYEGRFSCAALAWMPLPDPYQPKNNGIKIVIGANDFEVEGRTKTLVKGHES